jgi:hypothetical protein
MKYSACGTAGRSGVRFCHQCGALVVKRKDDAGAPVTRSDYVGAVPEAYLASARPREAEGAAREALEGAERPLADRCRVTLVVLG